MLDFSLYNLMKAMCTKVIGIFPAPSIALGLQRVLEREGEGERTGRWGRGKGRTKGKAYRRLGRCIYRKMQNRVCVFHEGLY